MKTPKTIASDFSAELIEYQTLPAYASGAYK